MGKTLTTLRLRLARRLLRRLIPLRRGDRGRAPAHHDRDGRRDEPAGVGGRERADEHGERKALEHFAAEQEQRQDRQEHRARRDDRPRQRLVEAGVDHPVQRFLPALPRVLAHAVEDDDHVVHRVAHHRQHGGDDVERHFVPEEHEERQRDEHVVERRHDRAERKAPLKAEGNVGRDGEDRQHGRGNAPALQVSADDGAHAFSADDLGLGQAAALESARDLVRRGREARTRVSRCDQRHADEPLVAPAVAELLDLLVSRDVLDGASNLVFRHRLFEPDDQVHAALELDVAAQPLRDHHRQAGGDDDRRQGERRPAPPEEVEVRVGEDMHG